MELKKGLFARCGLVVALGAAAIAAPVTPTLAGDRGADIAAGIIGGAALGALAGSAAAGAYAPPPPPATVYVAPPPPPPPGYIEREEYAPPPPRRCHREVIRRWDDYAGAYVERVRRVCDEY